MRHTPPSSFSMTRSAAATLSMLALLAACGAKDAAAPAAAGANKPPPEVGVITTRIEPVALQSELPGRVEPVRVAQVRARVNGVVLKRLFTEGSEVKAGQLLYQIDPAAPFSGGRHRYALRGNGDQLAGRIPARQGCRLYPDRHRPR